LNVTHFGERQLVKHDYQTLRIEAASALATPDGQAKKEGAFCQSVSDGTEID
jgi:hypothetical protein